MAAVRPAPRWRRPPAALSGVCPAFRRRRIRAALAAVILAASAAGCDRGGAGTSPATPAPTAAPPVPTSGVPLTATSALSPSGTSALSSPGPAWGTEPVTVVHDPAVPPVPVLTGVRSAAHKAEGFDRMVFDIRGALPGYTARYVTQVRAEGSDKVVSVPGKRYLLVALNPAQAHSANGDPTVSGVHKLDLPALRGYALVGDFEGYVTIALGLDGALPYRIAELPGRIYVDVAVPTR